MRLQESIWESLNESEKPTRMSFNSTGKVIKESIDLYINMSMFRYNIRGVVIYLETNKKIRNKSDANTIFDIYVQYSGMDLTKYTQEQIDVVKDMILVQMDLVNIVDIHNGSFSYQGKNISGSDLITDMGTIDNRLYVLYDNYK